MRKPKKWHSHALSQVVTDGLYATWDKLRRQEITISETNKLVEQFEEHITGIATEIATLKQQLGEEA